MNNINPAVQRLFTTILLCLLFFSTKAQIPKMPLQPDNWKEDQLISPESLAILITRKGKLKIYNIGVVQNIKGAVNLGPASEKGSLEKLKNIARSGDKSEFIVIYCGCCPMGKCPNIRPAFDVFKAQRYTNVHLLDLPVNIKVDWIDKGFPVE
jgi:thiosulfate/3-mercaptopyruvate sulfurtransferase